MTENKPLLVLQLRPEDRIADSEYACFLKYGQLPLSMTERMRIERYGIPADLQLDNYSAILVGGSPFDISTPLEKKSAEQLQVEAGFQRLLQQVIARDFPFLGACSGNGLLGNYLGAGISSRYGEAVGCVELDITEEGKRDKLLVDFPDKIDVLLGHKEACDETPAGAALLMTGQACPVQMFRVGNNVYATQFHPEGDAAEFTLRIDAYKHHGYFLPEEAEQLVEAVSRKPTPFAQEILRRFVAAYVLPGATREVG